MDAGILDSWLAEVPPADPPGIPTFTKKRGRYGGLRGVSPRNAERVRACPSCGERVSTNGFNFVYHLKACDYGMCVQTVPAAQLDKFNSNARRIALERMCALTLDLDVKPGANVAAVLEVGAATEMGHNVHVHMPCGRVMVGFVFDIASPPSVDKDMAPASDAWYGM